ncbi:hypothetical protein EMPS_03884 [Entomortierella parvispora]|uniref:Galactose oxidase n=1 Tax=Entomortierella parvispora TaxID=205924 RepID=A0A9P3H7F3_9FUNG|nr:hypothetical protein EMPS_03884 [Entomortierella parvispora]
MLQRIFTTKNGAAARSRSPLLLFILLLFIAPLTVFADTPPSPRRLPAFAKFNNKLYLQGGYNATDYVGQLMSLDLSVNWPSSAPAWDTSLPAGIITSRHGMAAIPRNFSAGLGNSTQGYLLLVGSSNNITASFWNAYDIQQNRWSSVAVTPKAPLTAADSFPHLQGQSVVTDPSTGYVYVVGGYWNTSYNRLMIMDPSTRTLLSFETVTNKTSLTSESAVWSTARNTILVFGGSVAPPNVAAGISLATVQEYNPATAVWSSLATTGDTPAGRMDQCVAASDDGTTMILFGGSNGGTTFYNSIYLFDVATAKWTQGTPAPNFRTRMACAYSQNQFVAWGGSSGDDRSTMLNTGPVIYDIQFDKWSGTYSSTPPTAPPAPSPGNGTDSGSSGGGSGGKSSGAVIGGAVGAVVVIVAVIGFIFYKKKKNRAQKAFSEDARVAASLAADGDNSYHNPKGSSDDSPPPSTATPDGAKGFYANKKSTPSNDYLIASKNRRQQQQMLYQQQLLLQQQQEQQQQQHPWVINTATTPKADAVTMAGLLSESRPYTGYTDAYSEHDEQLSLVPPSSNWSSVSGSRPHSGTGLLTNDERGAAAQNNSNAFVIHHPLQKQGGSNPLPPAIPETPPFQSTLAAAAAGLASALSANNSSQSGSVKSHSGPIHIPTHSQLNTMISGPIPNAQNQMLNTANFTSSNPSTGSAMSLGTGPSQGISPPMSPVGTAFSSDQQVQQQLPRQMYAGSAGNRSISSEIGVPGQFKQLGNYQPQPYRPGPYQPGSATSSAAISVPGSVTGSQSNPYAPPSRPYTAADTAASSSSDDIQHPMQQQQQQQQQQKQKQQKQQQQQQQNRAMNDQSNSDASRPRSPSALLKDTDEMYGASPNMSALRDSKSPQIYPDILAYYAATAPSTPALANKSFDGLDAKQQELLQQLYQEHQQQLQQLLLKQQLQQREQELELQIHQQQQQLQQQQLELQRQQQQQLQQQQLQQLQYQLHQQELQEQQRQQQLRHYLPSGMPSGQMSGYNAQKEAQMAAMGYNAQKAAQMAAMGQGRSEGYRSPSPSRGPHLYVAGTPTDYVAPPRKY